MSSFTEYFPCVLPGHSIQEASEDGESLLSLACSAGYYELAEVLLRMRASVEDRGIKGMERVCVCVCFCVCDIGEPPYTCVCTCTCTCTVYIVCTRIHVGVQYC